VIREPPLRTLHLLPCETDGDSSAAQEPETLFNFFNTHLTNGKTFAIALARHSKH
jgi:hypothetical protein